MRDTKEYEGIKYLEYEPEKFNGGLILFFHGYGKRGSNLADVETEGLPTKINDYLSYGYRVIAPQLTTNYTGWPTKHLQKMCELVVMYGAKYNHVTGLSMGGMATLAIMKLAPGLFDTAGVCCGKNSEQNIENLLPTKIKAWHGTSDSTVGIGAIRKIVEGVKKLGGDIELLELNAGHAIWNYVYDPNNKYGYLPWLNNWQNNVAQPEPEPEKEPVTDYYILNGELIFETEKGVYKSAVTKL